MLSIVFEAFFHEKGGATCVCVCVFVCVCVCVCVCLCVYRYIRVQNMHHVRASVKLRNVLDMICIL